MQNKILKKAISGVGACIVLSSLCLFTACKSNKTNNNEGESTDTIAVTSVKFNADSAYASVVKQCDFGPRTPNSVAHDKCKEYIVNAFKT